MQGSGKGGRNSSLSCSYVTQSMHFILGTSSKYRRKHFKDLYPEAKLEHDNPDIDEYALGDRSDARKAEELTKLIAKAKMEEWLDNGILLGWLIDIKNKQVYIYRADGSIEIVKGFDKKLNGESVMKGFEFDLNQLKMP